MYSRQVGSAALICAVVLVLAGCVSTTGGQSMRAGARSTSMVPQPAPWTTTGPPAPPAPEATFAAPPAVPTVTMKPRPKVRNVIVSGIARGTGGIIYRTIVIGFRRTTCPECAPVTVTTDHNGAYAVSVPMGSYVVACAAGPYVCTVAGSEDLADTVTAAGHPPTAVQSPDGPSVYGRVVTTDGLPVPYATITLLARRLGQRLSTNTATDGSYHLAADSGNYLIICITPDADFACGPTGGSGGPDQVTVGAHAQRVEFVLCRVRDHPRCLS